MYIRTNKINFLKIICFIFIVSFSLSLQAQNAHIYHINQAKKLISNSQIPPDFNQQSYINLPDHWQHDPQKFYGSVWYQLNLDNTQNINHQWGIYLPEINMNAEVWINDTLIGSGGSMMAPISRYWHSPLMFVFSPSDLKLDNNKINIRVVAYANEYGQLGRVTLGDRNMINTLYQKTLFNTVNIHIISGLLAGVYFIFMSLIWYKRRDPVFFWGALVCGSWSISSLNLYIIDPIFSELIWEKIMQTSMGWIPLLFFFFIRRLNNLPYSSKFEGSILIGAGIFNLVLMTSSQQYLFFISRNFHLYTMVWGLISILIVFYAWLKNKRSTQLSMVVAFTLIAISGIHDIMVQNKVVESGKTFWLDYSVPIILLMIGYLMVTRFLAAVKHSENLNKELESRVNKAQQKIASNYEKILHLETEQASNHERERIYRNLHDDMGSKLLSLVYKADNDDIGNLARDALKDLRSIVSKEPKKKYLLNDSLELWHKETLKRCIDARFKCEWQQQGFTKDWLLNTEQHQNMQRLQSEAISNIIKHSAGNLISIAIKCRFNCLQISIFDNGDYADLTHWQEGRGISSMRFRVKQLLGKIRWKAINDKGGLVQWIIPLT